MTPTPFHVEPDPAAAIEVPAVGTPSRTLHKDDDSRVVVFGFAEGEELSEHAASRPAVIQVLRRPAHERDRRTSPGSEPATGIVLAGGRSLVHHPRAGCDRASGAPLVSTGPSPASLAIRSPR